MTKKAMRRWWLAALVQFVIGGLILYLVAAYVLLPLGWRRYERRHPALLDAPRVTHTGTGIPAAIRDRMFYPLVSGREGGSGLGLTLAQAFIAQHEGSIECESIPGCTVFTVLLPLESHTTGNAP